MENNNIAGKVAEGGRSNNNISSASRWVAKDGTVDYQGRPADRRKTGGWRAAPLIFVTEMCERMAAFGIGLNLVTYLVSNLRLPVAFSANIVTNYLGTAYLTCLLGGYLADTWIGRFNTILVGALLQFLGMLVLTLSATLPVFRLPRCSNDPRAPDYSCRPAHGWDLAVLYVGLYLVAFGTGGIKSCVSPLGADQFDDKDPREKKLKSSFFNWFFMAIEVGAILSVTVLIYIQVQLGRGWGFGVTAASMIVAIVVFVGGSRLYRYQGHLKGSPLTQIVRVLVAAYRNRKLALPSLSSELFEVYDNNVGVEKIPRSEQFLCLDKAAIKWEVVPDSASDMHIKARPKPLTVTQVEEVKMVVRMLPIALLTIVFYTVYAQLLTFSVEQGQTMDRRMGRGRFEIPPASLGVFREISIVIMLSAYGPWFVPFVRRFTGHERGITTLQRIGTGLLLSVVSMLAAALVEAHRLRVAHRHGLRDMPNATVPTSVFWLIPQFMFLGAGEVFTYVGQLEFCYQESPVGMRSMGTALFLCTISLGFYTSSFLVTCVNEVTRHGSTNLGWLVTNLNHGRLDLFYCLLLVITVFNFAGFLACARWYTYKAAVLGTNESNNKVVTEKLSRLSPFEELPPPQT